MTVRVTESTPDRLVLVRSPSATLAAASCILVGGLLATGLMAVFEIWRGERAGVAFAGVGAMVVVVGSILIVGSAATITVTLDRATDSVRVERRGQFGRSVLVEALSVVEDAVLEESDVDGTPVFRPALRLLGGRMFPLTWGYDSYRVEEKRNAIEAIRGFLSRVNTNDNG